MKLEQDPYSGKSSFEISPKEILEIVGMGVGKLSKIRVKKNPKNKIGIVIGVKADGDKEERIVKNYLVDLLTNYLNSQNLTGYFNIIPLDQKESSNIDNTSWVEHLEKHNGNLIIYGSVLSGEIKGEKHYSFNLEAGVVHKPIPTPISFILGAEFASLFPRERFVPVSEDLPGLQATTELIGIASEYMIAVAFYVSGYLGLAMSIFQDLESKINSEKLAKESSMELFKNKIPQRIVEVAYSICDILYNSYSIDRDEQYVKKFYLLVKLIKSYGRENDKSKTLEAIYIFLIEKNVDLAIDLLKDIDNELKHYNIGFLYFFKGDFESGLRNYKKASKRGINSRGYIDLENFITDTLESYKDRYVLYFARGFINYKEKKDFALAKEDFRAFLKNSKQSEDSERQLVILTKIYLEDIAKKTGV